MTEFKCVIVESPYGADTDAGLERNATYLNACLRDCIERNESPYASHGLLTRKGVLDDQVPEERKRGIKAGFAWRQHASATVVYLDLGISGGMQLGIEHAQSKKGINVNYRAFIDGWDQPSVDIRKLTHPTLDLSKMCVDNDCSYYSKDDVKRWAHYQRRAKLFSRFFATLNHHDFILACSRCGFEYVVGAIHRCIPLDEAPASSPPTAEGG